MKRNKTNSEQYTWGNNCLGWHLLQSEGLSIIEELMPANTQEKKHYHSISQQFFYILKGRATFKLEDKVLVIESGSGIHIEPNVVHQIKNESIEDLEFLVISQPIIKKDRVNL